ncbi:MAG: VWA domain-containing protein [Candidatus Lokiarchaeota archaeon]|nr:VWA domain-containing protein [Candidatus Lokiarchaeota archaeon]
MSPVPKSYGLVDFAAEFVLTARKCHREVPGIKKTWFTSRQSLAIASLGTSRLLRSRQELGVPELVGLAVLTSPPEAQKYAEMIALRILVGDEREALDVIQAAGEAGDEAEALRQALTGSSEILKELLDFLGLNQSVDLERGLAETKFAELAEDTLFSPAPEGEAARPQGHRSELARQRLSFEVSGGRSGILKHHLTSWNQLMEHARSSIKQSVPFIDKKMLAASQLLGFSGDVQDLTREQQVRDLAEMLKATSDADKEMARQRAGEIVKSFSQRQLSQAMDTLEEYKSLANRAGFSFDEVAPSYPTVAEEIGKQFKEGAKTFDEVLAHPALFSGNLDYEALDQMLESTKACSNPLELLAKAKQMDELFGTNMSSKAYDRYQEEFEGLAFDDVIKSPIPSSEWMDALETSLSGDDRGWNESFHQDQEMLEASKQSANPYLKDQLTRKLQESIDELLATAEAPEQLTDAVNFARDNGFKFKTQDVMEKGKQLGMSSEEIARLVGSVFEYLKEIIQSQDPSYERVSTLMGRASLSREQVSTLIKESVKSRAAGALGALAAGNLMQVAQSIPPGDEGADLFEQALGAGGGENLLQQWFMCGKSLPPWLRQIAKDAAKRVMIDIAKARSCSLIGSSEAGPLPEGTTRPYILGDDADSIDLEETMDNILDLGKRVSDVLPDDFVVRKEVTGRRCVVFLVDISGSMGGKPLACASIACAMLLMAFCRDELGVALFESNTHVICEINQSIEIDSVIDEILDLEARGGTQMQAALRWAEGQFQLSRSQDKMFVMVTDAMLGDFDRSKEHMRNIADQNATSVLIVPEFTYGLGNIQSVVEAANAQLVTVGDWKKFPEIVSRILSRL